MGSTCWLGGIWLVPSLGREPRHWIEGAHTRAKPGFSRLRVGIPRHLPGSPCGFQGHRGWIPRVSLALGGVVIIITPRTGLAGHVVVLVAVPELAQGGGVGLGGAGGAVAEAGERRAHLHPLARQ